MQDPYPYLEEQADGAQMLHTSEYIIPLPAAAWQVRVHGITGERYVEDLNGKEKPRYVSVLEKRSTAQKRAAPEIREDEKEKHGKRQRGLERVEVPVVGAEEAARSPSPSWPCEEEPCEEEEQGEEEQGEEEQCEEKPCEEEPGEEEEKLEEAVAAEEAVEVAPEVPPEPEAPLAEAERSE